MSAPQRVPGEQEGVMASIEDRVRAIIAEQLDQDGAEIVPEASFIDDLGADSLDLVELVMHMEEEFDVEIPDDDARISAAFKTL